MQTPILPVIEPIPNHAPSGVIPSAGMARLKPSKWPNEGPEFAVILRYELVGLTIAATVVPLYREEDAISGGTHRNGGGVFYFLSGFAWMPLTGRNKGGSAGGDS